LKAHNKGMLFVQGKAR